MPQIRANFFDLPKADRVALTDLVSSLGANPDEIAADLAVTVQLGQCRLHLTEHLLKDGQRYLDVAADQVASRPLVFEVDPAQLPASIRPGDLTDKEN